MDPGETLQQEHHEIERLLDAFAGMGDSLVRGRGVPLEDLETAIETAARFADGIHHAKEEAVAFPALREAAPDEGERLVKALEGDHKAGRKLIGAMREAAPAAAQGDLDACDRFARNARIYRTLLKAHIDLEHRELLPLMDRALDAGQQEGVAAGFDRVARESDPDNRHFRRTIDRLVDLYAPADTGPDGTP